ncbi:chemotaxis protein CheR [Bacteriovorax stolpii]|uniref:protein-glutamate O-methyltransferase n=1 Tax=Bacteriovorax stolpii TaxID=960 RepID=A0A2K9NNM9_BACTC|nr:protein-glutamate O-methyltransferase CheR [Bacteriovorax stolpii]AUN97129.1 chemotaxis protein CheR [Bacteriovorax stolpii]TDP53415.1 CheR-type MCP methyltransferase [Bacteriovorax stolpii]
MNFALPDFSKNFEEEKHIQDEDFAYFQALVLSIAGISLSEKKRDLLKTRLGPYIRDNNHGNYKEYRRYLEGLPEEHPEWQNLINLITTNKTDFFREPAHFEYIETKLIPEWVKMGKKEVRIWSAACSSGEEPYTLAMFLKKKLPAGMTFKITASDIDTNILSRAKNGVYPIAKFNEIPEEFQKDSIDMGTGAISEWFRVKKKLKDHIDFKLYNLIEDNLPSDELFDLVLCRNVMIYFPKEVIKIVADKIYKATTNEGCLFIGHSESLQAIKSSWFTAAPSIYKKTASGKRK